MTSTTLHKGFWTRIALDGFRGVSEAAYPENSLGAPCWHDVDMVRRAGVWFDALPPKTRQLMLLLFASVELSAPVLGPGLRRFSRMPVAKRLAMLNRWRSSRIRPFRLLGDSLKSATTMMYLSHPDSLAWVGAYSACDHPSDPMELPVRPNALAQAAP